MRDNMKEATLIEDRFQVFAVRASERSQVGRRGLKGNSLYYFYQGYNISDDGNEILVKQSVIDHEDMFNDYLVEQSLKYAKEKTVPHISISAIVGKNGSGKSTIIEFVIRLINNFSTILFGEQLNGEGLEHLHYIDWMEGDLYFYLDEGIYRLRIIGRLVELDFYELDEDNEEENGDVYILNESRRLPIEEDGITPLLDRFGEVEQMRPYLEHFFYTVVSNYSIYAYNTLDYQDENNTVEYEREIYRDASVTDEQNMKIDPSQCNWLHGIFHKNDGYKTPLVLTPYRDKGNIDINVENTLSRERFISMLMMSYDEKGGFKRINGHLDVEHIKIQLKGDYGREFINNQLDITPINKDKFLVLHLMIQDTWTSKLLDDVDSIQKHIAGKTYADVALNYIVYKTIKIATKYEDYKWMQTCIEDYLNGKCEQEELNEDMYEYVDSLIGDRSHITRKIRQCLAYLLTDNEDDVYKEGVTKIEIKNLSEKAKITVNKLRKKYGYDSYVRDIEDLIPPAFFDTKMILKEVKGKKDVEIAFETLSSGEKQQIFSVCGLLYHLLNINSVKEDTAHKRFSYNYINLILEEIELYFHPDFQKKYITLILDGIAQLNLNNIYGINLCFVTHSPFILSDIPRGNLLIMKDGRAEISPDMKTFGANIYDMLKSSFFLEGTPIGSYAQWVITRTIIALSVWRYLRAGRNALTYQEMMDHVKNNELEPEEYDFLKTYSSGLDVMDQSGFERDYSAMKLSKTIKTIDELFVRQQLMKVFYEVFPEEFDRQREIAELERKLEELRKGN